MVKMMNDDPRIQVASSHTQPSLAVSVEFDGLTFDMLCPDSGLDLD